MSEASTETKSSRTARIAQIVGVSAPILTLLGIGLAQAGLPAMVGFGIFALAILLGLIAFVLGAVGLILTRGGVGGRGHAVTGIAMGAIMMVALAFGRAPGTDAPAINDITTNLDDPPAFIGRTGDHGNAGRDMSFPPALFEEAYTDDEYRTLVRTAYPDLRPIELDVPPQRAFEAALAQAEAMEWTVTHQDAVARVFEAEDETALFRFVDDISVRVSATASGSRVDIRSKSRDGRGDIGANAARIRAFRDGLEGRV